MPQAPKGVKLDQDTQRRLEALAVARDRSPHWLMCAAIKLYLDREERHEAEKREDEERWQRYQLTGQAASQEAVGAWLAGLARGAPSPRP